MSVLRAKLIACPRCGASHERTVALSLNASLVPNLRSAILDGNFQNFSCDDCGVPFVVDGPLLWIDFSRRQWIGVFPSLWEGAWQALEGDPLESWRLGMVEGAPPLVGAMSSGFHLRTVFGFAQLRDKLRAHEAGIDDRWLELLKLDLMRTVDGVGLHPSARLELVRGDEGSLVFRNPAGEVTVPRARLAAMQADPGKWQVALDPLSGGPYVDTGRILVDGSGRRP